MRLPNAFRNLPIRTKLTLAFALVVAPFAGVLFVDPADQAKLLAMAAVLAIGVASATVRGIAALVNELHRFIQGWRAGNRDASLKLEGGGEIREIATNLSELLAEAGSSAREMETQNWLRTEVARITALCHSVRDLNTLAQSVIKELAPAVGAGAGVFYVSTADGTNDADGELAIMGTYAFDERKRFSNRIRPGDGLVGQCALERKPILLTRVPADYMRIESGLGDEAALNVLVTPVLLENQVMGVVELASFRTFTAAERTLVAELSVTLGVLIDGLKSRLKTEQLLVESQRLSEEAQAAAEELEVANVELVEKKSAAERMAEQLQSQAEELQAANEELEEKSEALDRQRVKVEEKNKELEAASERIELKAKELELASKYKSEFLANMSHELRTPLNSLLILAQSLAENQDGNLTEDQKESASIICSGGRHLLSLINDILDLSKVEAGKLNVEIEDVPVRDLVRSLEREFAAVAKQRGLELRIEVDGVPPTFRSDRQRCVQILRNLLSNAFKFTHAGSVTLRVAPRAPELRPRSAHLANGGAIALSVTDTGIGISADKQEAIFGAFQQADGSTSRRYGGTGLGLTISRELARLLGGEIHLESRVNRGSSFTLLLPLEAADAAAPVATQTHAAPVSVPAVAAREEAVAPPVGTNGNIAAAAFIPDDRAELRPGERSLLIVEDDDTFAGIVMKIARRKGYKCLASDTAQQGMALALHYQPSGILLDVSLPDYDGLRLLDALKKDSRTGHIPVHVVSGHDRSTASLERGAIGFLMKPTSAEALQDIFAKVETAAKAPIKRLLVVEDDAATRKAIGTLLNGRGIEIANASSGAEARTLLRAERFDCAIVDLSLGDMSGFELLDALRSEDGIELPPVVVYTGRDLSWDEHSKLREHAQTIVVKGVNSPERLLDEVSLFLHSVEAHLPEDQRRTVPMVEEDNDGALRDKRILLVDDDMRNSFALAKVLRQRGLDVRQADNGQRAIEVLENDPGIGMVLMDLMMPVMDGYEAMRRIRVDTRWRNLPILALTARAMPEDRMKCVEAGANDYMCKPVDIEKLLSMMRVWAFNSDESQRC